MNIYQLLVRVIVQKTLMLWDKKGFLKLFTFFFCLGSCRDDWWRREDKILTATRLLEISDPSTLLMRGEFITSLIQVSGMESCMKMITPGCFEKVNHKLLFFTCVEVFS